MLIFYEIPIILIVFVVLGLLGMDISFIVGIIKWLLIIAGVIGVLFGICIGLDPWDKKERIESLLTIIFSAALIILSIIGANYIDSLGYFSLYDILDWIF